MESSPVTSNEVVEYKERRPETVPLYRNSPKFSLVLTPPQLSPQV